MVDRRAVAAAPDADPAAVALWREVLALAERGPGPMGLAAGERPMADVEVLAGMLAAAECTLARFVQGAASAGCAPIAGRGAPLTARGWSGPWANRLARAAELADQYPRAAHAWAAGIITSDHLDAIVRNRGKLTDEQVAAVIDELDLLWGRISPTGVEHLVRRAAAMLHPPEPPHPDDPSPEPSHDEVTAYRSRFLSFANLGDRTLIQANLPRIEGELVQAAIEAIAETLRTTVDDVSPSARRADALVQLVNDAGARDALPTRGGLPVALTVTLEHTVCGDAVWTTSSGRELTPNEAHFATCDALVTPIDVAAPRWNLPSDSAADTGGTAEADGAPVADSSVEASDPTRPGVAGAFSDAARISALAALMFEPRQPIAVGRTHRTATAAQRRALAVRDRGCVIPGCGVPAESCQVHHLTGWASGGLTELRNLALLCWSHHRQVDLRMWTIVPAPPSKPGGMSGLGEHRVEGAATSADLESGPVGADGTPHRGAGDPPAKRSTAEATSWPADHGAPFVIRRTPRSRWRT